MELTSLNFILFFMTVAILYYLIKDKLANYLLLAANIVFCYAAGGVRMIFYLGLSTITTYFGALYMGKYSGWKRKAFFLIPLLLNTAVLILLKYVNFFVYTAKAFFQAAHIEDNWSVFNFIAPLGISFYTLQVLGYLIDVQRGTCKAEKNLITYALFTTFFPQLISGPINRYSQLAAQFGRNKFDYQAVTFGIQRMLWGFFKKLVISERLAIIVNTIYGNYSVFHGGYIFLAMCCFTFQLYTDFSGCMDIVLGASEVLGIQMAENFQTPFFSRTLSEFWRRWHITLGTWVKDYIFYPILKSDLFVKIGEICRKYLGKKNGKKVSTYLGMFILWFTVGLWHGGSWNYIIGSGLLHWFFIVSGQMMEPVFLKIAVLLNLKTEMKMVHVMQSVRTFFLFSIGLVFFRSPSLRTGLRILQSLFTTSPQGFQAERILSLGLDFKDLTVVVMALGVGFFISILKQKYQIRELLSRQNIIIRWTVYYCLIFSVIIFGLYGAGYNPSGFIYQRF